MSTKTDITNLSSKLPVSVVEALAAIAAYVDTAAAKPGSRADRARAKVHELVAALNSAAA